MRAADSKIYNTDCLTEEGINLLLLLLQIKNKLAIQECYCIIKINDNFILVE